MFSKILIANWGDNGRKAVAAEEPNRLQRAALAGDLAPMETKRV